MGRRNFVKNNYYNSDNFGEQSLFYNYYDDSLGTWYTADETSADAKFAYRIIPCDSGLDVFEKYKSAEIAPESDQILIFVEKENPSKSNFFGTACRVKMGEARKELMWRLYDREVKISVHDDINLARSLEEWAEDIAYYNRNSAKAIDKTVLANAVKLELSDKTDADNIFNTLLGLNNKLADWMRSGVAEMDTWKFTEENYEFAKYGETLKPLISIPTIQNAADFYRTGKRAKNTIQNSGIERLSILSEHLDQIVFTKAYVIARSSPTVHDDILFSMVWIIKEYLEKNFPESIKNLLSKTQGIITLAKFWILKIGKNAQESVALVNAFLCGIVNGLISLLQMVVGLLAFVIDNISTFELEAFSKEKIAAQQEKLEFIEDLIDVAKENIVELFKGIFHNLASIVSGIRDFIRSVGAELQQLSRYWWAFILGSLALELIVDAVAAFFSGGTSLAAMIGAKVTRVSANLAKKGIKVTQTVAQRIATSSKSIYKYVKELFEEIIEAIKSGRFLEWLEETFYKLTRNTAGLRKVAYRQFLKEISKENLKELTEHIFQGHLRTTKVKGVGRVPSAKGIHSEVALSSRKGRVKPGTRKPPNPKADEVYQAEVQALKPPGYWIDKIASNGKVIKTTLFPKNWNKQRIMEEIAYAFKNKTPLEGSSVYFNGITTSGIKVQFVIRSKEIKTLYPLIE